MSEDVNKNSYSDWMSILSTLSERERQVIIHRFGLMDIEPCTLDQVGLMMSVTRERVRQIEAKALNKMRERARVIGSDLGDYFCS